MDSSATIPAVATPSIYDVCHGILEPWRQQHCPQEPLDSELKQIMARVPTWISPNSVAAGLGDILSTVKHGSRPVSAEARAELADRLAMALRQAGWLQAQPRPGRSLG